MILNKAGLFLSILLFVFGASVVSVSAQNVADGALSGAESDSLNTVQVKKEKKNPFKWIGNYLKNVNGYLSEKELSVAQALL